MSEIVKEAANCFKIKLLSFQKSRAAFLINAEEGTFMLKKYSDCRKIEIADKTAKALSDAGFNSAESFMTADGKPFAILKDGIYALTSCGSEKCNFSDLDAVKEVSKALAQFHNASSAIKAHDFETSKTAVLSYYSKRIAEARHTKKWLNKQSRLCDLDVVYIKKHSKYLETAEHSAKIICAHLNETPLALCLSEIKEDNVFFDNSCGVTFTGIENCLLSANHTDLCRLIRRFVKKNGNDELVSEIIGAYNVERPLSQADREFINAYLSFPHKFFSLANKYYNSKKILGNTQLFLRLKAEASYQDKIHSIFNL